MDGKPCIHSRERNCVPGQMDLSSKHKKFAMSVHIVTVWGLSGNVCSGREKQLENFQSHGLASLSCWSHPSVLLQGFSVPFPSIIQPYKVVQHSFIFLFFHSSTLSRWLAPPLLTFCPAAFPRSPRPFVLIPNSAAPAAAATKRTLHLEYSFMLKPWMLREW